MAKLRKLHPYLTIELATATATRQFNLQQSGIDLAVAVGTPITPRLFTEQLREYRLAPSLVEL